MHSIGAAIASALAESPSAETTLRGTIGGMIVLEK